MNALKFAIPKGSMQPIATDLLKKAGLEIEISKPRTGVGVIDGVKWIQSIYFQKPREISAYLKAGDIDVAVVGQDWLCDADLTFPTLLELPGGRKGSETVKIVLAVSKGSNISSVDGLPKGCQVATEYVGITKRFFADIGRSDIQIMPSFGNTEQKILFGVTAIVDVVESGDSIRDNDLLIIYEIMQSKTVLVANEESWNDASKRPYIECFTALIEGVLRASRYVLISANVPQDKVHEAGDIMGGLKGPTRAPLQQKGWFSLTSFVPIENEIQVIFALREIEVTGIYVVRDIPLIMS